MNFVLVYCKNQATPEGLGRGGLIFTMLTFIESWNGLDWKGPERSSSSPPPAIDKDTFHQTRLLKAPSSLSLNTSRDEGIHSFSRQPVPVPRHPQSKEFLSYV